MKIDIPDVLAHELQSIAAKRKLSIDQLMSELLRGSMPELRASAIDNPANKVTSNPSPARAAMERRALWLRVAEKTHARISGVDPKVQRRVAAIATDCFIVGDHQTLARLIDSGSTTNLPSDFEGAADADAGIRENLRIRQRSVLVEFQVHARVPMQASEDCAPFGGATSIRLIARESPVFRSGVRELVAIAIEMPVSGVEGRFTNAFEGIPQQTDQGLRVLQPEVQDASLVLDHILTVLRFKGVGSHYAPIRDAVGPPYSIIRRETFGDGSVRESCDGSAFPFRLTINDLPRYAVAAPLRIRPDLFKESWDQGVSEVAIVGRSKLLEVAEQFRKMMLLVESCFSRRPGSGDNSLADGLKTKEATAVLERSRAKYPLAFTAFPTNADVATELVAVRDLVSHLQRHTVFDGQLEAKKQPYGLMLQDVGLRHRLPVAVTLASELVDVALRAKLPSDAFTNYTDRRAPTDELIRLYQDVAYVQSEDQRLALEIRLISNLTESLNSAPVNTHAEAFVEARLAARSPAPGLIALASRYSNLTRQALDAALDDADEFGRSLRDFRGGQASQSRSR